MRPGKSDPRRQLYDRISRSVDAWIADKGYLKALPTVQEIADDIGVDPDMLSYLIRIRTGQTILGWRKCLRIEEAKRLLLHYPAMPVSSVAEIVGIGDRSNFKRQFTEVVRQTPEEWRRQRVTSVIYRSGSGWPPGPDGRY